jgi:hypothetical protein
MTSILKRALTPFFVAVAWIIAIVTMVDRSAGGLEPLIAGMIGGAALMLQTSAAPPKDGRVGRLKAPVVGGCALLFLALGIAVSVAFDPELAARALIATPQITVSITGIASVLVQIGLALAMLAVIAQAGPLLLDDNDGDDQ